MGLEYSKSTKEILSPSDVTGLDYLLGITPVDSAIFVDIKSLILDNIDSNKLDNSFDKQASTVNESSKFTTKYLAYVNSYNPDYLDKLKGSQGAQGVQGIQGIQGISGIKGLWLFNTHESELRDYIKNSLKLCGIEIDEDNNLITFAKDLIINSKVKMYMRSGKES